jgi:hypothetical protein
MCAERRGAPVRNWRGVGAGETRSGDDVAKVTQLSAASRLSVTA